MVGSLQPSPVRSAAGAVTVLGDELLEVSQPLAFSGVVERLSDGDTITVRSGSRRLKVRLLGIDAPELHFRGRSQSPWAEAAHRALQTLLPVGGAVSLLTDDQAFDQYGRLLAYVRRGARLINVELVRMGWAVAYQIYPNLDQLGPLQAATESAQAAGRGIWDRRRPLPALPYEFRPQVEGRVPNKFCGDSRSRRYVLPHQYQRVPVARRVFFYTEADARAAGFQPA